VIDLLVDAGDGLVVVDYKTDAVSDTDLDAAVSHHEPQLAAYAVALEASQPKPVTRAVLVFVDPTGFRQREIVDLAQAKDRVRSALALRHYDAWTS